MNSNLAHSLESPATAIINFIAEHTDYQTDPVLLEIVLRLKQRWPQACDYSTCFKLQVPSQISNMETKVRVEAYSILISGI